MTDVGALPTWHGEGGEPMPWWVRRCYHAWVVEYWRTRAPVPVKRSRRL